MEMKSLLISFAVGLIGRCIWVIRVKSPAPPIVALLGLFGMVLGEQAGGWLSNDTRKAVEQLLAPMLKKTLFVAISRVVAPASEIEPFVAEHLAYMNALEAEGMAVYRFQFAPVLAASAPAVFVVLERPRGPGLALKRVPTHRGRRHNATEVGVDIPTPRRRFPDTRPLAAEQ
jgi:XapX domain-containing protein